MKIIHASGEAYDLAPGSSLEIERTNPFFNEYGEQSLPITLPPTDKNRRLLLYPDSIAGINKASQRINSAVMNGIYHSPARQAILSANRKTGIETSFYLNTGAFYEKINEVRLSTIFEKKALTFASVEAAITFCRNLYITHDNRFACFPAALETGVLNRMSTDGADGYPLLYNSEKRTETVDEKKIALDPGYYITPFIRANHLLSEIFAYFGYTMADSFFTRTEPFASMVFLNTNIDTIVNKKILYSQIVPDCTAKDILDVFRYRFCAEFIPDEINKIIRIELFDNVLKSDPVSDLTKCITGRYTVNHPGSYKQVKLSCDHISNTLKPRERTSQRSGTIKSMEDAVDDFKTLVEVLKKYPEAQLNKITGEIYRIGYKGDLGVKQKLGSIAMDYYAGEDLEKEEKKAPDLSPDVAYTTMGRGIQVLSPYVGAGRAINSEIVLDSGGEKGTDSSDSAEELLPMLSFVGRHSSGKYDFGTILNYNAESNKVWNYTLAYHGEYGLFEKFWRGYDSLLRNSLLEVTANLLLTDVQKISLPAHSKVIIDGQEVFMNRLKYSFDQALTKESSFYTTKLYEPVSVAVSESTRIKPPLYKWLVKLTRSNGASSKNKWIYKEEPVTQFYPAPTVAQYSKGGRYYEHTYAVQFYSRENSDGPTDAEDGTLTVWLEAATV